MTRLTEEMVVARSKQSDLSVIKKLNCWGAELTDVSILKRMVNVEVLALSINKIRTLVDFQHCQRLKELYVRKNRVADLSEIRHLKMIPSLRILWLGENPCAEDANYRLTVLRALPRLEKLDNTTVEPDEVEEAARKGAPIYDSDVEEDYEPELDTYSRKQQYSDRNGDREDYRNGEQDPDRGQDLYESPPQSTFSSRPSALRRSPPATTNGRNDYDHNSTANHGHSHGRPSALPRSPPNTNGSNYIQTSPGRQQRCYSPDPVEETRYEQPAPRSQYFERSASVGDELSTTLLPHNLSNGSHNSSGANDEQNTTVIAVSNGLPSKDHGEPVNGNGEVVYRRQIQHSQSAHSMKETSPMNGDHGREAKYYPQHNSSSARHSVVSPQGDCYYDRQNDRYSSQILEPPHQPAYSSGPVPRDSQWERDSVTSTSRDNNSHHIASNVMADHKGFTRRPMTRNSNLLSAVLCLVKELDYTSLEVTEMAVRCRMDELANRP